MMIYTCDMSEIARLSISRVLIAPYYTPEIASIMKQTILESTTEVR